MMRVDLTATPALCVSPYLRSLTQIKGSNTMSKKVTETQDQLAVAERWAALLRSKYRGGHAAKRIARDFKIETRTAKSWLTGEVSPRLDNFMAAAKVFGIYAVLGVLFPDTEEFQKQKLRDDLSALRSQLDHLSNKLGELDHEAFEKTEAKNMPRRRPPDR